MLRCSFCIAPLIVMHPFRYLIFPQRAQTWIASEVIQESRAARCLFSVEATVSNDDLHRSGGIQYSHFQRTLIASRGGIA